MSRIGNKLIPIAEGLKVEVKEGLVDIKGPKGEDIIKFDSSLIGVEIKDNMVHVTRVNDEKRTKQMHGTTRALINNAMVGCHEGFKKVLDIVGIGYRAEVKGKDVYLYIGHVKPTVITPLEGVTVTATDSKSKDITCTIEVSGSDKFKVGQTAALIHDAKRPEPYLGKGIRYRGEHILRKEGKRAGAGK